jgi:predicted O-methyltransferase YrrM
VTIRAHLHPIARSVEARAAARGLARAPTSDEAAFNFIQSCQWRQASIRLQQIESEFLAFLARVRELRPVNVIEIGAGKGGTLFFLARAARDDAHLISVDLPGGEFGGGYPVQYEVLLKSFARGQQTISLVRGNSHDQAIVGMVRALLDGATADLLLIDGDHFYEGVRADFASYGALVRPGGLIAFHDIVPGPEHHVGGVPQFWSELKSEGRYFEEIVENWDQGGYGIGIVQA